MTPLMTLGLINFAFIGLCVLAIFVIFLIFLPILKQTWPKKRK